VAKKKLRCLNSAAIFNLCPRAPRFVGEDVADAVAPPGSSSSIKAGNIVVLGARSPILSTLTNKDEYILLAVCGVMQGQQQPCCHRALWWYFSLESLRLNDDAEETHSHQGGGLHTKL
jgi:hypothetical protein